MNVRKLCMSPALGLLVGVSAAVVAQRAWADEDADLAARRQFVVFLNGQNSSAMFNDTVPGYAGGQSVLPHLLSKGWKVTTICLSQSPNATGYAIIERK